MPYTENLLGLGKLSYVGWISSAHPPFISANGGHTIKLFAHPTRLGILKQLKLFYSKDTEYLCIKMSASGGS